MNGNIYHLFILNPKSFWNKWKQNQITSRIRGFFASIENKDYEIHISRFPRDAVGFIPEFARKLPEGARIRVYAVGGDGILFDCLNGIAGLKNTELGTVPYGHTNNFLRSFGRNEIASFRNISRQINAPAIPVDIMRCGVKYALSYCLIGLEAETKQKNKKIQDKMNRSNFLYRWLSKKLYAFHYFIGGIALGMGKKKLIQQHYEIEIDSEAAGGEVADGGWGLAIFNNPYYGESLHPVNSARPDDGILDMLLIRAKGFLRTFGIIPFYVTGRYRMFPHNIKLKRLKNIRIRSASPMIVSMDDTVFYESSLDIELLPAALRFIDASRYGYRGVSDD
jgi:diacylglycerol kinase family enzyme